MYAFFLPCRFRFAVVIVLAVVFSRFCMFFLLSLRLFRTENVFRVDYDNVLVYSNDY